MQVDSKIITCLSSKRNKKQADEKLEKKRMKREKKRKEIVDLTSENEEYVPENPDQQVYFRLSYFENSLKEIGIDKYFNDF